MLALKSFFYGSIALLLGLVLAVYWPGLSGGFVFDDFVNLLENPVLQAISQGEAAWWSAMWSGHAGPVARPLAMLLFGLEVSLFGFNPLPMKITNLIIHGINACLVWVLFYRVTLAYGVRGVAPVNGRAVGLLAWVVALVWALAPINLTAVLYVVQRMESLATLFMLAGLLMYLHGRQFMDRHPEQAHVGWRWVWSGLLGAGLLAVLCKESGVMLPLYALLLEWLVLGGGGRGSETRRRLGYLYALVLVLPAMLGLLWLGPGLWRGDAYAHRPFTLDERLWTEARVLWDYLRWTLAPTLSELSLYHDAYPISQGPLSPATSFLGAMGLLGLLLAALLVRKRWPWLSLGVLWFLVMHLLVSTVLSLELVYEHRNYMGSMGLLFAMAAGWFFSPWASRFPAAALVGAVSVLAVYGGLTFMRASEWGNPFLHAYFESQRQPNSVRAQYELGLMLNRVYPNPESQGFKDVVAAYERATQVAQPSLLPYQALLFLHGKHGVGDDGPWWHAAYQYVQTQPLSSQDVNALHNLVRAQDQGQISLDKAALTLLLELAHNAHPGRADLTTLYANALLNLQGDWQRGGQLLAKALVQAPRNPQFWANWVEFQLASGRLPEAAESLQRLKELSPWWQPHGRWLVLQQRYEALKAASAPVDKRVVP